jgi:hypothetical protein
MAVELTERSLTARPTELLRAVERLRDRGWLIALDDVGAQRESLALMPLLRPDIIKLDLRLVQQRPDAEVAEIVTAVNAEAERSGAVVLAEGIETLDHVAMARALGATLGQGWLFGRPGPLPTPLPRPRRPLGDPAPVQGRVTRTPFEIVAAHRRARPTAKRLLIEISRHLERQALRLDASTVVIGAFQHARHLNAATRLRYAALGRSAAFVAAIGAEIDPGLIPGIRTASLDAGDLLAQEWDLVVIGPHFAGALVAHDHGDTGRQLERGFDYVVTYDRDLAVQVARALMARIPVGEGFADVARKVA